MAHATGKAAYISFAGTAVHADYRKFTINRSVDVADTTAGADTEKSYIAKVKDADISLSLLYNGTAGTAVDSALKMSAEGTLVIGPEGTAAGKPKYECLAIVTSRDLEASYDDTISLEIKLKKNGAWTANWEDSGSVF